MLAGRKLRTGGYRQQRGQRCSTAAGFFDQPAADVHCRAGGVENLDEFIADPVLSARAKLADDDVTGWERRGRGGEGRCWRERGCLGWGEGCRILVVLFLRGCVSRFERGRDSGGGIVFLGID